MAKGLKHTRCLRIITKQYPQEDKSYVNLDKVPESDDDDVVGNDHQSGDEGDAESDVDEKIFEIFPPPHSASGALKAYIGLLILKLPSQPLHTFWYSSHPGEHFLHQSDSEFGCDHAYSLSTITISILLKHQGASIHALNFSTTESRKRDLANLKLESLTTLGMAELRYIDPWATELLAKNH